METKRISMILGGILGLLAVVLGAFGAHALSGRLELAGTTDVWATAVDYQMWHALALLVLAAYPLKGRAMRVSLYCFGAGVLLFSGSLYWLALEGPRWLGPVTPLGGLLLIVGWAALVVAGVSGPRFVSRK